MGSKSLFLRDHGFHGRHWVLHGFRAVQVCRSAAVLTVFLGAGLASIVGAQPCVPAASGLVSWWAGDGDDSDETGGNPGTNYNGAGFVAGEVDQCFTFNGSGAHVRVPDAPNLHCTDGLTIEAWVAPTRHGNFHLIVSKWDVTPGGTEKSYALQLQPDGLANLTVNPSPGNGGLAFVTSTNPVPTNQWTHLAGTYDGSTINMYVNGVLQSQVPYNLGINPGAHDLGIGATVGDAALGQAAYSFAGSIDEPCLYNRALSDTEILDIFNAGAAGRCKAPIAPTIIIQPTNQTVTAGQAASFRVAATGRPLSFQWRRNGLDVPGATDASLTVSNTPPSKAGTYNVEITNTLGSVTSTDAALKVSVVFAFGDGKPLTNAQTPFTNSISIQLQNVYSGGSTFYTLDGSKPTFASAQYSGPFPVNHTARLRALGYSADFFESAELDPPVDLLIVPSYALSASTPGGGSVSLNPPGGTYVSNSVVTVTATPASGWTFLQWLGDSTDTNPIATVTVTRPLSLQAIFGTTLGTTAAGGGSVSVNPASSLYPYGTTVLLSAIPQSGNYFAIWGNAASGNLNPLPFVVTNANRTVSSLFTSLGSGQAALTVVPVGRGWVSVNPRANVYNVGQVVSVTATPQPGQSFNGWSGDADGSQNPLSVTLDQSKAIYANFTRKPALAVRSSIQGIKAEGVSLTITGDFAAQYRIESSSNLVDWAALGIVTNDYGTSQFFDSGATNSPLRFYRVFVLP
jgi:hypothetical protein